MLSGRFAVTVPGLGEAVALVNQAQPVEREHLVDGIDEPGIVHTGKDPNSQRRAFVIPESVLMRVYRRRAA